MIERTFYIILIAFWYIISLFIIKHIESKIYFISRMKKKYNIIKPIKKQESDNKLFDFVGFIVWILLLSPSLYIYPIIYFYNKYIFIIMILIVIIVV